MENNEDSKVNKNNEYNQLIILGNGFDLKCDLHTHYDDFFDERFGIKAACKVNKKADKAKCRRKLKEILKDQIQYRFNLDYFDNTDFIGEIISNAFEDNIRSLDILTQNQRDLADKERDILKETHYTKWDAIFLFTFATLTDRSIIYWNDVERIIYFVITWALDKYEEVRNSDTGVEDDKLNVDLYYSFIRLFSNFEFENMDFRGNLYIENKEEMYAPVYLRSIIEKQFMSQFMSSKKYISNKNINNMAIGMLQSLNEFEKIFSNFIVKQISDKPDYVGTASKLLYSIVKPHIDMLDININPENYSTEVPCNANLDIFNFNYSLNKDDISKIESSQENIKINSLTNIHGIATNYSEKEINESLDNKGKLPAPIFGVDSHDIFEPSNENNTNFDDPRIIFTKSFRLLDNHINDIRKSNFQNDVDVITFFGHSLSHADYSYFESIFDKYHIYDSNVKLEFYYYHGEIKPGSKPGDIQANAKIQERKTMKNVVELLTAYGETVPGIHGENIINKLMLEQRLSVLPYPEI